MIVDLSRVSSMDWWVALILIWAGRVVGRRGGVLTLAAPQPAVARLLNAADASKAVVMCASVQRARRHAGRIFQRLLEFRVALREFQRWSEDQAEAAGLTHVQRV